MSSDEFMSDCKLQQLETPQIQNALIALENDI